MRGSATLLYATASAAGVVNVVDKRIPKAVPEKGYEGELFTRYNDNSNEKLLTLGTTVGLGKHVALRMEGLTRHADNYDVPHLVINTGEKPVNSLPDSYNRSKVGTLGLSWIGQKGYIGASFSERQDRYGLVGHNHMFDQCSPHLFGANAPYYVQAYPHLMTDGDISKGLHDMHCGNNHAHNAPHSHDNIYGHHHEHGELGPWVALTAKRYDIRGEWLSSVKGIDKIDLSSTYSQYYHDERGDGQVFLSALDKEQIAKGYISSNVKKRLAEAEFFKNNPESVFHNKGLNTRLELKHTAIGHRDTWGEIQGTWGVQYQTQKSSVHRVYATSENGEIYGERQPTGRDPLVENTNKQLSLFGVEQYKHNNFTFELGARAERQEVPIKYDIDRILQERTNPNDPLPDLSAYKENAFSYAGTILWDFKPNYRLSFTASHNERLPSVMELYYHGKHLATNSFQYGNRLLDKERSNNFELGLLYEGDKWDYKISTYYNLNSI